MRTIDRSPLILVALLLLAGKAPSAQAATNITVTNQAASAYIFNGATGDPNATLQLVKGQTYTFQVSATGHPFHIATAPGLPPADFVDAGLTGNGTASGTITFTVPSTAPAQLFYQCGVHTAMTGTINVVAAASVPAVSSFTLGLLVFASLGAGFFLLRKRAARS